jgi:hypothetical protein
MIKSFIGFDFGHGHFCLSQADFDPADPNANQSLVEIEVNNKRTQVTALALVRSNGALLIGEQADAGGENVELWTHFKTQPSRQAEWQANRPIIVKFAGEVRRHLEHTSSDLVDPSQTEVIVGRPTGWSREDDPLYEAAFREAGLPNVHVIAESDAAFIIARDQAWIPAKHLDDPILIIDVGSSTTDFTHVVGLNPGVPLPVGQDVGAYRIDEALYEDALSNCKGDGAAILALVRQEELAEQGSSEQGSSTIKARCMRQCRLAKEEFFSTLAETAVSRGVEITDELEFRVKINRTIMDKILSRPLECFPQPVINLSWREKFAATVQEIACQLKRSKQIPTFVVLTGGAARMPLVRETCKASFPNAKVIPGQEPERTVARGLASFGRWRARRDVFLSEVKPLYTVEVVSRLVRREVREAQGKLISDAVAALYDAKIAPYVQDLAQGKLRVEETVLTTMQRYAAEWDATEEAKTYHRAYTDTMIAAVNVELIPKIRELAAKWSIPPSKFRLSITAEPVRFNEDVEAIRSNIYIKFVNGTLSAYAKAYEMMTDIPYFGKAIKRLASSAPGEWTIGFVNRNIGKEMAVDVIDTGMQLSEWLGNKKVDQLVERRVQVTVEGLHPAIERAVKDAADRAVVYLR